jgi:hypothetical protein
MPEIGFSKVDIIIIIILCLLVAFIIGFNIIQIVDNKLSSVTINVPPSKCIMPPIYVNLSKDSNNNIDLNLSSISIGSEQHTNLGELDSSDFSDINNRNENLSEEGFGNLSEEGFGNLSEERFGNLSEEGFGNLSEERFGNLSEEGFGNLSEEGFGNLTDYPKSTLSFYPKNLNLGTANPGELMQKISNNEATRIIENDETSDNEQNPNYNNYNNIPYLVDPILHDKGFYYNKVKLINNKNSPLLKLQNKNYTNIQKKMNQYDLQNNEMNKPIESINFVNKFSGYNQYADLRNDSYANVTSIGKNLIVPFTSYPVAS